MANPPNRLNSIRLVQGQTKVISVKVKTKEGRAASLLSATVHMSVRQTAGAPVLIAKTSGDGIEVTDPAKGEIVITLSTTDTEKLEAGAYRYDVWIVYPGQPGEPDVRMPIIQYAEIHVEDSVTEFA